MWTAIDCHRRISSCSRAALSSYSSGGDDDDDDDDDGSDDDDDDDDSYYVEVSDGLDEIDISTAKENPIWTDDLVR